MTISIIISINKDVVQIHDDEDVKFLCKDLVDKLLEACKCVRQPKEHHLIFEVTVSSFEHGLLLVPFANSHLMVCTGKVELGNRLVFPNLSSDSPVNGSGYQFLIVRLLRPR